MEGTNKQKLQALFKTLGKNLAMDTFDDRLMVQKIPYLAQIYGVDLNYHYFWYLRGPYSKDVASDGLEIVSSNDDTTVIEMQDKNMQEFADIIKPHMNEPKWLEIAASVIYLRERQYKKEMLDKIVGCLVGDMTCGYKNFDEDSVRDTMKELIANGLLRRSTSGI